MPTAHTKTIEADKAELLAYLTKCGQQHVLDNYDALTSEQRAALGESLRACNLPLLNEALAASLLLLQKGKGGDDGEVVEPPPAEAIFDVEKGKRMRKKADCPHPDGPTRFEDYERRGYELIAAGRAAVLLLAGGSGTRLGVSYPKGCFTFADEAHENGGGAPPMLRQSSKSLFQFHCEKLKKAEELAHRYVAEQTEEGKSGKKKNAKKKSAKRPKAGGRVQLMVMTSAQNDAVTRDFFAANAFFGLREDQVHFFQQTSLPVYAAEAREGDVDGEGRPVHRILMEDESTVCLAPGGNGGVYQSLVRPRRRGGRDCGGAKTAERSALDAVAARGVRYVQIFSVDNLLARIADPVFFGYTAARPRGSGGQRRHVTVKTTPKAGPAERVGVFARLNGAWGVVEYTELGEERANLRRSGGGGELLFNCGNIACHCCTVDFLRYAAAKMESETLYHAAIKKVKVRGGAEEVMGAKLEAFIFDMFRYCGDSAEIHKAAAAGGKKKKKGAGSGGALPDHHDNRHRDVNGSAAAVTQKKGGKKKKSIGAESTTQRRAGAGGDGFGILQVDRAQEFAPIKNATGAAAADTPKTAAALYLGLSTLWARNSLRRALRALSKESAGGGAAVEGERQARAAAIRAAIAALEGKAAVAVQVEVSPTVSYAGEGLARYTGYLVSEIERAVQAGTDAIILVDQHVVAESKV